MSDEERQEQFPEGAAQAAFDAVVSGEPMPKIEAITQNEAPDGVAAEPAAAPDPWDGVPSVLKDHISQLESQLNQALAAVNSLSKSNNELRSNIGRIDSIQSELAKVKPPEAKPPEAKQEKWDRVKEEYDDIAEGLEERLAALQSPAVDIDQIRREVLSEAAAQIEAAAREARELSRLERKYPDWESVVVTDDFANVWLPTQAPGIRALVNSNDAQDAIRLLDMYAESHKQPEKDGKTSRLERAVAPTGNPAPVKKVQMTAQEAFDQHFANRQTA